MGSMVGGVRQKQPSFMGSLSNETGDKLIGLIAYGRRNEIIASCRHLSDVALV